MLLHIVKLKLFYKSIPLFTVELVNMVENGCGGNHDGLGNETACSFSGFTQDQKQLGLQIRHYR
jgi:hypothetical protein